MKRIKRRALVLGCIALAVIGIAVAMQHHPDGTVRYQVTRSSPVPTVPALDVTVRATSPAPLKTLTLPPFSPSSAPVSSSAAPVTSRPAPPSQPVTPPPPAPSSAAASSAPPCFPLTNGGNCYEPGEFCRASDHGVSGTAGDGEAVTCEDNDGWRWEPA